MALLANRLHRGDCVEKLAELEAGTIDLVFADPPFNIGYEYDVYDDRRSQADYLKWSRQWIAGVHRCLKPNGTFWLAIGDEYAAELKVLAQSEVGFHCRSWVIWYYTFGVNCARGFSRSHTHLFHFVKDADSFVFNGENPLVRVASARQLVYADARANPKGRLPDNTWILRPQDAKHSFGADHDTWYFARVAGTFRERQGFHGCQMPEQLLGRIIRVSSHPGDVVLDPFAGSGTTLAVAKKLGRQWMGFELSAEYAARVEERLSGIQPGDELDGPANPLHSAPTTKDGRNRVVVMKGRPAPRADEALTAGVARAFEEVHEGHSVDHVLCDPERSAAFTRACQDKKLAGVEHLWKRTLLRMRKSSRLGKSQRAAPRVLFADHDSIAFASEIATRILELDFEMTLDEVLCAPTALERFDEIAQELAPGYSLFHYRWVALTIRKRAMESRRLAQSTYAEWATRTLPAAHAIDKTPCPFQGPGVYVLASPSLILYVGESEAVDARLQQIIGHPTWRRLGLSDVRFLPDASSKRQGLQSALIGRLQPLFNSSLLAPKHEADLDSPLKPHTPPMRRRRRSVST